MIPRKAERLTSAVTSVSTKKMYTYFNRCHQLKCIHFFGGPCILTSNAMTAVNQTCLVVTGLRERQENRDSIDIRCKGCSAFRKGLGFNQHIIESNATGLKRPQCEAGDSLSNDVMENVWSYIAACTFIVPDPLGLKINLNHI
jgi:hypothetical protein